MPIRPAPPATDSSDITVRSAASAPAPVQNFACQLQQLGLVLWVSLSMPITASTYYLLGGTASTAPGHQNFGLLIMLMAESSALLVLWYVMGSQGRNWKDIGWNPCFADVPRAASVLLAVVAADYAAWCLFQFAYRAYAGHFLTPKSLHSIIGFGVSGLSIAFVCLNPFFEELIVRAFTMSEVMRIGGSPGLAIVISVILQMSYHLYQGLANALVLTVGFIVLSIYYAKTRRIVPVILVHLFMDSLVLIKGVA